MDELVDYRAVALNFIVFHFVMVEVFVEFFSRRKAALQQLIIMLFGNLPHHVLHGAVRSTFPPALRRHSHDGVCGGAPKFFGRLQMVSRREFLIGHGKEVQSGL